MLHIGIPRALMLMSYLGTLKAGIYYRYSPSSARVYRLRDPVLLAGVASVWLFFLLLRRWPESVPPSLDAACWPWIRYIC